MQSATILRILGFSPQSAVTIAVTATMLIGCSPSTNTTNVPRQPTQAPSQAFIPNCSSIAIPSMTSPPDALLTPSGSVDTVTVTSSDNGATVFLIARQHLVVEVGSSGAPAFTGSPQGTDLFWTPPQAPEPSPLHRDVFMTCPGGSALSMFNAVGTGGTTVRAITDAPCLHAQPSCELGQAYIEIYVVIRPKTL